MTICRLLCCSALLAAAPLTLHDAAAQDRDVSLGEQAALAISGFAVGLGSYDRNLSSNTLTGSKLAVSLFRPWSDHLYLFGQLTTHLEQEDSGQAQTHIEIDNLIVNWTPPGASALTLSFGRFDAPLGYERDDEPLNLIPTASFNFELARPVKFTGLMARYTANPHVQLIGLVANGWNTEVDNNSGKTAGLRVLVFPTSGVAVGAGALYGPEEEGTNGAQRTLLSADATLQPTPKLVFQVEGNRGSQRDAGASLTWTGAVGTAFWRATRSVGVSVRGEILDDADGVTTGTPQTLKSLTISPWYFYREAQEGVFSNVEFTTFRLPAFSLRPALRFDRSDQPFFEDRNGGLRRSNLTALVELVYLF
jgi:putative OmpL-like beta-barrel porin-2